MPVLIDATQIAGQDLVEVDGRQLAVEYVRNHRARRYILRLTRSSTARVTVPRRGSKAEALAFVWKNRSWLERQLKSKTEAQPLADGALIYYQGELLELRVREMADGFELQLGSNRWLAERGESLKSSLEKFLRKRAHFELPIRTLQLADQHGIEIQRVSVRDQRSRWGSCSSRGTISLNWRLVQAPLFVRDYIIIHELAHRKHMNHSWEFWSKVATMYPDYEAAELWLKREGLKLR